MKIAQIAPLMESVPPRLYGGTERIVFYLTEELVRQGHDVTLFASGDSADLGEIWSSCARRRLRLDPNVRDTIPYYMLMLDRVRQHRPTSSTSCISTSILVHFPLFRPMAGRTVTTLHGRQDLPDLQPLYLGFSDMPLVSISNAQRRPIANANFAATVYHGLPRRPAQADLRSARRLCGVSRPHLAGEAARPRDRDRARARRPAEDRRQGGRVDEVYFPRDDRAAARCSRASSSSARSTSSRKANFSARRWRCCSRSIGRSRSAWSMIEAMACGTPVLAFRRGSVPEIIDRRRDGA